MTQPTPQPIYVSQADHDLLIEIRTKLDMFISNAAGLSARVTELERAADKQSGFWQGGRALWAFLTTIPIGLAAYFLGSGGIER